MINFPQHGIYRRKSNRIYFSSDLNDGEKVTLYSLTDKPSSNAKGYAWYLGEDTHMHLINVNELGGEV